MVEFFVEKFIPCRELFLTESPVNRVEKSIPFCDRGVFRMFISHTASFTYKKVLFLNISLFQAKQRSSGENIHPVRTLFYFLIYKAIIMF